MCSRGRSPGRISGTPKVAAEAARPRSTLGADYFRRLYAANPDPWGFATSAYERAKYAATLTALPRQRYRAGFEIGCSIGVLTRALAARCERLLAVDLLPEVLARARACCAGLPQVAFRRMAVPDQLPADRFDLIVLSEVGYYLAPADLDRLSDFIAAALWPQGHLLMIHWTGATDYPLSGDQVHDRVMAHAAGALRRHSGRRAPSYRLDVLERCATAPS
jgi:SAM-dependent methyltransferase